MNRELIYECLFQANIQVSTVATVEFLKFNNCIITIDAQSATAAAIYVTNFDNVSECTR